MPKPSNLGRRNFIKNSTLGVLAAAACPFGAASRPIAKGRLTPAEFKERMAGPILSFPTPYTSDYRIDFSAVRRLVELALKGGVGVFTLTRGNNQYDRLNYDEIKQLTSSLIEAVGGRGLTIAATHEWWTGQAVDYARFAESTGADALQLVVPTYGTHDTIVEHFKTVASATRLPLIMHLMGEPSLPLLERLVQIESVVGIKEEFGLESTIALFRAFGHRLNILAGGGQNRFLLYRPYGMKAYYCEFATFAPELTLRFKRAVQANDFQEARQIALHYSSPFLMRWSPAFWLATLELFGVASRYTRPPEPCFTDEQMKELRTFYQNLGLNPKSTH